MDEEKQRAPGAGTVFFRGFANFVLLLVGLFLLFVPGGCAVAWIYVLSTQFNSTVANGGLTAGLFIAVNAALAYGGYRLLRMVMK